VIKEDTISRRKISSDKKKIQLVVIEEKLVVIKKRYN
jgi:hypothetical protein